MTYLQLIYEFFKAGLFAVGGGLATIPFLKQIALNYDWFTPSQLTDMIAVSESTPGPIGVNMATYAGFNATGILGAIVATLSLVAPSVIVIVIIYHYMRKFRESKIVANVFYGLRPASTGLIAGAMFSVLFASLFNSELYMQAADILGSIRFGAVIMFAVFTVACFIFQKIHPIFIILAGGICGVLFGQYIM